MIHPISHGRERREKSASISYNVTIVAVSIAALISTFTISSYIENAAPKFGAFTAIVAVYLIACLVLYRGHRREKPSTFEEDDAQIEACLKTLEDANTFFAGSLNTSDTFRLVVSRVRELVPFERASMLLCDESREKFFLAAVHPAGDEKGTKFPLDSGVAGRCYAARDVVLDALILTVAVPLKRDAEVFGVIKLAFAEEAKFAKADASVLDAIGERIAPLVLASIAHERSQQNALTDATTELPNERAFHLVLENQVAEAIRRGSSRALAILAFDIKNFDDITARHGHAAGDRVLNFVAQSAKDSLRQMDFFARGTADEFLTIMPTATHDVAQEVIARIRTSLFGQKITVTGIEAVEIELNFGWACFGADGETPTVLMATARERKEQSKTSLPGSVLWFPQETAH